MSGKQTGGRLPAPGGRAPTARPQLAGGSSPSLRPDAGGGRAAGGCERGRGRQPQTGGVAGFADLGEMAAPARSLRPRRGGEWHRPDRPGRGVLHGLTRRRQHTITGEGSYSNTSGAEAYFAVSRGQPQAGGCRFQNGAIYVIDPKTTKQILEVDAQSGGSVNLPPSTGSTPSTGSHSTTLAALVTTPAGHRAPGRGLRGGGL